MGYAENLPHGHVEVLMEGNEDKVQK
ncbi:MAG: hypothetical protein ABWK05_04580 [Pyrobaculum sp.]